MKPRRIRKADMDPGVEWYTETVRRRIISIDDDKCVFEILKHPHAARVGRIKEVDLNSMLVWCKNAAPDMSTSKPGRHLRPDTVSIRQKIAEEMRNGFAAD